MSEKSKQRYDSTQQKSYTCLRETRVDELADTSSIKNYWIRPRELLKLIPIQTIGA